MSDFERFNNVLEYAPELGGSCLRWKGAKKPGCAGTEHPNGYWGVGLHSKTYAAHRIVWLLHHGRWPTELLDHRDNKENHIENLREATSGENQQNRPKQKNNTSGFVGVSWSAKNQKWRAKIQHQSKHHHLGYYPTPEAAHAAYITAKKQLHTFHPTVRETT
jgi:hypothetical protein